MMKSNIEAYLQAMINDTGTDGLPTPKSRIGKLLYVLCGKLGLIQKAANTQANWEQNDETAIDFVKNRTHSVKETVISTGSSIVATIDLRNRKWPTGSAVEVVYSNTGTVYHTFGNIVLNKYCIPGTNYASISHRIGTYGDEDVIVTFASDKRGTSITVTTNMPNFALVHKTVAVTCLDETYLPSKHVSYEASIYVNDVENEFYGKYELASAKHSGTGYLYIDEAYMRGKRIYCHAFFGQYTDVSSVVRDHYYLPLITRLSSTTGDPYVFSAVIPGDTYRIFTATVTSDGVWTFNVRDLATTEVTEE